MTSSSPAHLEPSELGTKEYWDATYSQDLQSHLAEKSHTGISWFEDSDAASKTIAFLKSGALSPPLSLDASFLDLGTGNGEMLFFLRAEGGFKGRMLGIDYSSACLQLAYHVKNERGYRNAPMDFWRFDIMKDKHRSHLGQFDVVLDKGTFDAISLSDEKDAAGRRIYEGYRDRVKPFVKLGGRFLVTSCNWTEEELKSWFGGKNEEKGEGERRWEGRRKDGGEEGRKGRSKGTRDVEGRDKYEFEPDESAEEDSELESSDEGAFEFEARVQYPTFSFGGKTGQSVTGVCFKKT